MKNIKLGVCDWGLPGAGLYAIKIAHDLGLDALSLRMGLYENDYPILNPSMQRYYMEESEQYGIEFAAIALNDFDNIPLHAPKGTKEYDMIWNVLPRALEAAQNLNIPMIQVPAFNKSAIKTKEEMERAAVLFQYLCDHAKETGMKVASENILPPAQFKELHAMVDRDNFYLYYDSQNYPLYAGLTAIEVLEELYPYMCDQIHVKDGNGDLSASILGTGNTGFFDTMQWLSDHDYTGYILIENYYDQLPMRNLGDPFALVKEDVEILKNTVARL